MARNRKYTTKILNDIVELYFDEKKIYGQVSATDIAQFATSKGYEGIKYYHFTRDKEIKRLIDDTNSEIDLGVKEATDDLYTLVEFNANKFLKTYKGNEKLQRAIINNFSDRYNELNLKVVEMQHSLNKLSISNNELEARIKELKNKNDELNKKNKKITDENRKLNRFKVLDEHLVMLQYLKENSSFYGVEEDTLIMILEKAGFNFNNTDYAEEYLVNEKIDKVILDEKEEIVEEKNILSPIDIRDLSSKKKINNALDILNSFKK